MFKRSGLIISSVIIAGCLPNLLQAEEIDNGTLPKTTKASEQNTEEVVVVGELGHYSATKTDTPIMETARSVSVINQQSILDKGALSLSDALMYSAGVTGQPFGFATRVDSYKIRGLDASQYQDSLQSLFGNYNNTRPHIYTLEQVEVLKGPASVLYGQGTPGGLVNIVSKRPQAETQGELVIEAGNFDHKQIAGDFTGAIDDENQWLYRLVAVTKDSGTQVDYVDEKTTVLAPSLSWRVSEDTEITALINHTDTESDTAAQFLPIEGTLYTARNGKKIGSESYTGDPGFNKFDTKSTSFTLLANHQFNDIWSLEATARHSRGEADYAQAWTSFLDAEGTRYLPNPLITTELYKDGLTPRTFYIAESESKQSAADVRTHANFMTGTVNHKLMIGVQHQVIETKENSAYARVLGANLLNPYGAPFGPSDEKYYFSVFNPTYGTYPTEHEVFSSVDPTTTKTKTKSTGIYINDQISIKQWIVNAGVRFDKTKTDSESITGTNIIIEDPKDEAVSLSAGAMYQFNNGISPYASYAESFEPVIDTDDITKKAKKPKEGKQLEAGIKYQPSGTQAFATIAYFDIDITNLDDPSTVLSSQQEGESTITGLELETIIPVGDFTIEAYLTKLNTKSPSGSRLASVPEKQASSWVSYRPSGFINGLKLGLGVRYNSESWGGADKIKTPSNTVGDLMAGYETESWDFSLNVNNFTDKEYVSTCLSRGDCFYAKRRTAVARMAVKF